MSAFIGIVCVPNRTAEVWCSPNQVELNVFNYVGVDLDPIAARTLAALLVRASEEAERMGVAQVLERNLPR